MEIRLNRATNPKKQRQDRAFQGDLRGSFIPGEGGNRRALLAGKCKVLLHLGNQLAFFIDKKKSPAYDFGNAILPWKMSASLPLC